MNTELFEKFIKFHTPSIDDEIFCSDTPCGKCKVSSSCQHFRIYTEKSHHVIKIQKSDEDYLIKHHPEYML